MFNCSLFYTYNKHVNNSYIWLYSDKISYYFFLFVILNIFFNQPFSFGIIYNMFYNLFLVQYRINLVLPTILHRYTKITTQMFYLLSIIRYFLQFYMHGICLEKTVTACLRKFVTNPHTNSILAACNFPHLKNISMKFT